ncbi:MAG TPA: AAA-like domain-containing protein [Anaerolineae bacterium]|nr:AAA-like domain-containing protein [Anaerolineae bacterium]
MKENFEKNENFWNFFQAGGTLHLEAPSYVKRPADDELYNAILNGEFCYILTARQMGKSSLMIRTAHQLKQQGVCTAIIDLTQIGTDEITAKQWYLGLITHIKEQFSLDVEPETWWNDHASLSVVQCFIGFLRDVVLVDIEKPVVIFIDEIDATLKLNFADDFFATIRSIYNARASNPIYQRLTFALFGVATPSDLIKDRTRTPFNIGHQIDLREITPQDANVFLKALAEAGNDHTKQVFDRVFYWTYGHPYLTQKLFDALVKDSEIELTSEQVDATVDRLFFLEDSTRETNLRYVLDKVKESSQKVKLLSVYRKVHAGKIVPEDERSVEQSQLKVLGLVRSSDGVLQVRNEIYRRVFDQKWIKANTPVDWTRRIAVISTVLVFILATAFGIWMYRQNTLTTDAQAQILVDNFHSTNSAEVRITSLAGLFELGKDEQARRLFFEELDITNQISLFDLTRPQNVSDKLITVVKGLYVFLDDNETGNVLLNAMAQPLRELDDPTAINLAIEIEEWLLGRQYGATGDFAQAIDAYEIAIRLNQRNPGTYFDRSLAYQGLNEYEKTLTDLQKVVSLDTSRKAKIQQVIEQDNNLFTYLGLHRGSFPVVADWFPTLTPTATVTPKPTNSPSRISTSTKTPTSTPTAPLSPIMTLTFILTPTPTRGPTRTPTAVVNVVSLQTPLQGRTYKNPVVFQWAGTLGPNQRFQVFVHHIESGYSIQSSLLKNRIWYGDLPASRTGEWRWTVSVIENRERVFTSFEQMFWLDPGFGIGVSPISPPPTPKP